MLISFKSLGTSDIMEKTSKVFCLECDKEIPKEYEEERYCPDCESSFEIWDD